MRKSLSLRFYILCVTFDEQTLPPIRLPQSFFDMKLHGTQKITNKIGTTCTSFTIDSQAQKSDYLFLSAAKEGKRVDNWY